jgi:hypothetical protein
MNNLIDLKIKEVNLIITPLNGNVSSWRNMNNYSVKINIINKRLLRYNNLIHKHLYQIYKDYKLKSLFKTIYLKINKQRMLVYFLNTSQIIILK